MVGFGGEAELGQVKAGYDEIEKKREDQVALSLTTDGQGLDFCTYTVPTTPSLKYAAAGNSVLVA